LTCDQSKTYQYCIDQKLIDAALIAKWWRKTGSNAFAVPTSSILPISNLGPLLFVVCHSLISADAKNAQDSTMGCMGCKYEQNLLADKSPKKNA
jgi:hypothetical protein